MQRLPETDEALPLGYVDPRVRAGGRGVSWRRGQADAALLLEASEGERQMLPQEGSDWECVTARPKTQ